MNYLSARILALLIIPLFAASCGSSSTTTDEIDNLLGQETITAEELSQVIETFEVCTEDSDCMTIPNRCECGHAVINQDFEADYLDLHDIVECPDPPCPNYGGIQEGVLRCVEKVCKELVAYQ